MLVSGAIESRADEAWDALSAGTNLAPRAVVSASAAPFFPESLRAAQRLLTDGRIAGPPAQMQSASFAAHWRGSRHVFLRFDLPASKPIGRVVLRVFGGRAKTHLTFPRSISAWVTRDGRRWEPGESISTDSLPAERGAMSVANVVLRCEGIPARSVVVAFELAGEFLFVDELAILEEPPDRPRIPAAPSPSRRFPIHEGLVVFPDKGDLVVSVPPLPTIFTVLEDGRPLARPVSTWFDLPDGIRLGGATTTSHSPEPGKRTRAEVSLAGPYSGPLVFASSGPVAADARVRIQPAEPGGRAIEVPVRAIQIPKVAPPRALHVSLGWQPREAARALGADPASVLHGLGFNAIALFPRYWRAGEPSAEEASWIESAKSLGMDLVYNESPFHVMEERHRTDDEIRTLRSNGGAGPGVSPCYRGRHYREELARIAKLAKKLRPQWVFFDSELWTQGARDAAEDRQCARLAPETNRDRLAQRAGAEIARDLTAAVDQPGVTVRPKVGLYAVEPMQVYQGLFSWDLVAASGVDFAMPSLYTSGDPGAVGERVQAMLAERPGTAAIPWLTAGTMGEFQSHLLRAMVLEAFFAGARGITYFEARDFDTPDDYRAHAEAVAIVSRFEEFFSPASRRMGTRARGDARITVRAVDGKLLALVGNYRSRQGESVELALTCHNGWSDVETGQQESIGSLRVTVSPGQARVFLCTQGAGSP